MGSISTSCWRGAADTNIQGPKDWSFQLTEVSVFNRFGKHFESVCHLSKENLTLLDSSPFPDETGSPVQGWMNEAFQLVTASTQHKCDDYKEFSELCLLYLDGHNHTNFCLKSPGGLHKARWMVKLLCSAKIVLLQQEISFLPPGTFTTEQQSRKLREFVTFVCSIYSSWRNTCAMGVAASWNDLCLYKKCPQYKAINPTVPKSAVTAPFRHLWYLTAGIVPLAIFSEATPIRWAAPFSWKVLAVKSEHGDIQDTLTDRYGTGFGKLHFSTEIRVYHINWLCHKRLLVYLNLLYLEAVIFWTKQSLSGQICHFIFL